MKVEISKPTIEYLTNKYPQLSDNIIQYFFFRGEVIRILNDVYENKHMYIDRSYCILKIPEDLAREYNVDIELDLIPNEDGVIYKVYI